jgi:hypothetical protein
MSLTAGESPRLQIGVLVVIELLTIVRCLPPGLLGGVGRW